MRFGVCADLADAPAILDAGFDYVEVGASGFSGFEETWDREKYAGVPILATNLFFDGRIQLFGEDRTPYREYAERTISRAADLGVPVMVVGSGAARHAPEGFDGDRAFIDLVAELSEIAKPMGVSLAPESLNRSETNTGNDLRSLALGLRDRGVGYTADSYHILYEWDADDRLAGLRELFLVQVPFAPTHVHIADLPRLGVSGEDDMLWAFAMRLKELGYAGNVSLECAREANFDYAGALRALRALFV
ncbi:MAG TPA: sugar phosphate isomerase/epimerase family protein [Fimbriimonadaceae bacterium]|nr:sugar phosphate isomerase/epimerase family protein [Fimbriimonadaceae bacterium]